VKARWTIWAGALLVVISGFLWYRWKQDEPRRNCVQTLQQLVTALQSADHAILLDTIVLPQAVQGRTAPEQVEFLNKALQDEVSPEGIAVLKKEGVFGPLKDLFPTEAEKWAKQAGAKSDDCVTFKMERAGICAEVVLLREGQTYRVVRCNNVKQMAPVRQDA